MNNTYEQRMLRDRENHYEWAKWIYFQLQEKHPDASRIMVWDETTPRADLLAKRKAESTLI